MSVGDAAGAGAVPRPGLLTSLTSAVITDGRGDVELSRETRGAPVDWGGVYAQHVRLTGPWRVRVEGPDGLLDLPATVSSARRERSRQLSVHRLGLLEVRQQIVPLSVPAGAQRALELVHHGAAPASVRITTTVSPYLLPVLVEGIRPVDFQLESRPTELRIRHRGFACAFRWDPLPSRLYVDRASWRGGRRRGLLQEVAVEHEMVLRPEAPASLRLEVVGGLERDLDPALDRQGPGLADGPAVAAAADREVEAWLARTPTLRFPDAPELEAAYAQAREGVRRLYSEPGDGLTGLVAGYPWYSAIWCRDLAWALPAVLWLGDAAMARASIDTVFRFQAESDLPLLGGEPGELPMQVSPGPVFLFGTSDTTLYYPALVLRLWRHRCGAGPGREWAQAVRRALSWGERRHDPLTGLLRNGGEVAQVESASGAIARVRYGIDAPDTTIWDSADRRDHAIDLQVLWHDALRAGVELADGPRADDDRQRLGAIADRLESEIPRRYAWAEERYLYDSIRGGTPVRQLRPNALRAVSSGLLEPGTARAVVRRAAEDDLTTAWGVRTLSSGDRGYSPTAYHGGQVWTIATAWAADAAYAAGEPDLGLAYLRTIAGRLAAEDGMANECYRGDRPEPFDSCFLLGFSIAPFLSVLFEGLWGLRVDARVPELEVRPSFPSGWRSASIERLSVGDGVASISFRDGRLEVGWSGPRPLTVVGPAARTTVTPGSTARLGPE